MIAAQNASRAANGDRYSRGAEQAPPGDVGQSVPPGETSQQAATRLVEEYGLAERAAKCVYGRLQDYPEGDGLHEHWREVMAIVQKTSRRKMERRHLLR